MKLIALCTLVFGGKELPPGSAVEIEDAEAAGLIARGFANEAPEEAMVAIEAEPDGTMSPEITGDGAGEPLVEVRPDVVAEPEPTNAYEKLANELPDGYKSHKPKRGKA